VEEQQFSVDYHEPEKRFISNALTITLNDGTVLDEVHIDYPVGHKRRVSYFLLNIWLQLTRFSARGGHAAAHEQVQDAYRTPLRLCDAAKVSFHVPSVCAVF